MPNHSYPQAAPVRTGEELAALEHIDRQVRDVAHLFGAHDVQYPALIAGAVLEQAEYPRAFPHLLLSACCISRLERANADPLTACEQSPTGWCLSPAVCYHVYAQLAGQVIDGPMALTARGRCFRHESGTAPGIRQIEFEMREIVLVGEAAWVAEMATAVKGAIESLALQSGLAGDWQVGEDPFFLPSALGKALIQRLTKVKIEYQSREADRLALASVNRHGGFFAERFGITTRDGEPVHTACIAVGLDRWCHRAHATRVARETAVCTA